MAGLSGSDYPNDSVSQVTGRRAAAFLDVVLSEEFVFARFPQETDFGIDCFVTVKEDSRLSGRSFLCQVKGTESPSRMDKEVFVYFNRSTLNFYGSMTSMPVILVFVDLVNEIVYWEPLVIPNIETVRTGKFRVAITKNRLLYHKNRITKDALVQWLALSEQNSTFSGINVGPFNRLSEYYLSAVMDGNRKSQFAAPNRRLLEGLSAHFEARDRESFQRILQYSKDVVMTSVQLQCENLQNLVDARRRLFICVDRELSFRGPGVWLVENWVSEFNRVCKTLMTSSPRSRRLELVRFFVFEPGEKSGLYGFDYEAFLRVLNETNAYGFTNILCSTDIFAGSDINPELADLWMIPYKIMVLNTPPLYTAECFTSGGEDRVILESYSSFFLEALEKAKKESHPKFVYMDGQISREQLADILGVFMAK